MSMTGKAIYEETSEDWDERFEAGWEAAGGNFQSLLFAFWSWDLLNKVAPFFRNDINDIRIDGVDVLAPNITIHDYGCALGDGTAMLQALFPLANVTGFDFSFTGVEKARKRWPSLKFEVGDVTRPEKANLIFCSHVLEHLPDTAAAVDTLLDHCKYLVVVVPRITEDADGGHTDAEPTEEWLKRVPPREFEHYFVTFRFSDGTLYPEGSLLLLFKGRI